MERGEGLMQSSENDALKEAEKLNEFVTNPKEKIKEIENKFLKYKNKTKETIKQILPDKVKPIMEGDTGDIVLIVIAALILFVILKILDLAIKIIIRVIFIVSIILAMYLLYQKYTGGG